MGCSNVLILLVACYVALSLGYSTSGTIILDPNNKPILLRGVARPSLEWSTVGDSLGTSDYQLMKSWGVNVVRLSLNQCYYVSGCNGYTSSYAATVDAQVKAVTGMGMGIILDLHWSNNGNSGSTCGQQNMADAYSNSFWALLAAKYKANPWVIFELYNEPHDVDWNTWRNGGTYNGVTYTGMQTLYNTVRAAGAPNLVLIGGLNWAYDLSGVPTNAITGVNIAYNTHPYSNSGKMPGDWASYIGCVLTAGYPVVATEFGDTNCDTSYYTSWMTYADANNIGWTAWGWYPSGCSFPSLINDWSGTPSVSGAVVKNVLTNGIKVPSTGSVTTKAPSTSGVSVTSGAVKTSTTSGSSTGGSTTGSSHTVVAFTDAVLAPFLDDSWAAVRTACDTAAFQSGKCSYSFQPTNYGAVYFYYAGGINPSIHKSVDFYVNPTTANPTVNFNMVTSSGSTSSKIGPDQRLNTYATGSSLLANVWTKVSVPLSLFPQQAYDGFWVIGQDTSGATQPTIYLDTITVVGL